MLGFRFKQIGICLDEMNTTQDVEQTIARTELARRLRIHPVTLRRLEKEGALDPIHINSRHIRYRIEQVNRVFAGRLPSS